MSDTTTQPPAPHAPSPGVSQDQRIFVLGVAVVVMVFSIVILLFFIQIPDKNAQVLTTVIGQIVGTGAGGVLGYYFGSSMGSKTKDETISNLAKP